MEPVPRNKRRNMGDPPNATEATDVPVQAAVAVPVVAEATAVPVQAHQKKTGENIIPEGMISYFSPKRLFCSYMHDV